LDGVKALGHRLLQVLDRNVLALADERFSIADCRLPIERIVITGIFPCWPIAFMKIGNRQWAIGNRWVAQSGRGLLASRPALQHLGRQSECPRGSARRP